MRTEVVTQTLPVACFAPPLTDAKVAEYRARVDAMPLSAVKDACDECLKAIEAWWQLPESTRQDVERFNVKHRGKDIRFAVVPLEEKHVEELYALVPWDYEINAMQQLFDGIPAEDKPMRDMAFHLLWHARELCLDREPLTQDKLPN